MTLGFDGAPQGRPEHKLGPPPHLSLGASSGPGRSGPAAGPDGSSLRCGPLLPFGQSAVTGLLLEAAPLGPGLPAVAPGGDTVEPLQAGSARRLSLGGFAKAKTTNDGGNTMLDQQELPLNQEPKERLRLAKRLGVYHLELVRDRQIDYELDTAINALTAAVNVIQQELQGADRERLLCLWLNARHHLIGMEVVSVGTLTASLAHPREIFKGAILKNAAGIILAHNHPSGDPNPSDEDRRLTRRLAEAGRVIGIDVLDHVIVGDKVFYSFKTQGVL